MDAILYSNTTMQAPKIALTILATQKLGNVKYIIKAVNIG
ncbi:unnamed protein product [marine sediment metagenome]|uniref:Uncharacterized protein n=1 Tax=marine sediment metagenome TaxID=412755 RepID=X0Z8E1_9ZZZZ